MTEDPHAIDSVAALEALYGPTREVSIWKETDRITSRYRALIGAAPFVVLATSGPGGLDCSPRGDPAPIVTIEDERTLLLPDRRGNNRIDSLRNIVSDPRVALLFLIPGVGETLRVNGRARISAAPELLARFAMKGSPPATVLVISVEQVYFQCPKALVRARLWDPAAQVDRTTLPSTGEIIEELAAEPFDAAAYDAAYPERLRKTIY